MNLYQKLLEIQKSVSGLKKDKSANGYAYVTGDKVLSMIKPAMNDLGVLLKMESLEIKNIRNDYKVGKGNDEREKSEILTTLKIRFTWIDSDSGEKDENIFFANGQNGWDKGVGSALTYAERYFLLKFFHIATDEDDIDNPYLKDKRPLLLTIDPLFDQIKQAIKDGKRTIVKLEEKYQISEEIKQLLNS